MATRSSLGAKAHEAMTRTNEIIAEHASAHHDRMRPLTTTGTPPVRTTNADEITRLMAYQAEQNLALAEIVHELAKAERNRKRAAERERKQAARKDAAA